MRQAITFRQQQNKAKATTPSSTTTFLGDEEGQTLVGFGTYKNMSRFDLFSSTCNEHKRYVESILSTPVTYPGGQLDKLKRYLQTQRQVQAEDAALVRCAEEVEQSMAVSSAPQEKVNE